MRLLKEPLLHFLIAGSFLFGAYSWFIRGAADEAKAECRAVRITANEVEWLKEIWSRQWQRPPTEAELGGLLADYVKEELLTREARELGLDQNDTIVRRRLAQKMEFLIEDTVPIADPQEDELLRIYDASPERFQISARVSFTQIYFNRDRRGAQAHADAVSVLEEVCKPGAAVDVTGLGDPSLLPQEFTDADDHTVTSQLGEAFGDEIFALEPGKWHGPIESGYGLHLVRVKAISKPRSRSFADARGEVLDQWRQERQKSAEEQYLAALIEKYRVVVDEPLKPLLGPLAVALEAAR